METSEVLREVEPKVIHHVDRVNLYDFGYEKSGSVKGDPDLYASYLNRILNGDLVENKYSGFTEEEKKERIKQIKGLELHLKEKEEANAKVEEEIKAKEKDIDKYRKDLLHWLLLFLSSRSEEHTSELQSHSD